jgi:hypothetical protein
VTDVQEIEATIREDQTPPFRIEGIAHGGEFLLRLDL